jgi:putative peptide zinc metalloprotease protein
VWTRTEGHPVPRGAFVVAVGTAAGFLGYIWWPNGDYRPIQKGERGTIQGAVEQFAAIPTGRPGLTRARQAALSGAPLVSSQQQSLDTTKPTAPATTTTTQTETQTQTTDTQTTETGTGPSVTVPTPVTTVELTVSTTTTTSTTP